MKQRFHPNVIQVYLSVIGGIFEHARKLTVFLNEMDPSSKLDIKWESSSFGSDLFMLTIIHSTYSQNDTSF